MNIEKSGSAAVAWLKGTRHMFYEDRYRMLPQTIPLVGQSGRGEIFAVFDGIGSAPEGMRSAQRMADVLIDFYRKPECSENSWQGVYQLLMDANLEISRWGSEKGPGSASGGCAGTVIWIKDDCFYTFHAGDTVALIIRDGTATRITGSHDVGGAVYKYFGLGNQLEIDFEKHELIQGDRLVLLSDGVTSAVDLQEAADVINEYDDSGWGASVLGRLSQLKGSTDDITVMIIDIEEI